MRCNKTQLMVSVFSVTALFLVLQLIFVTILKNSLSSVNLDNIAFSENIVNDKIIIDRPIRDINPRFGHRIAEINRENFNKMQTESTRKRLALISRLQNINNEFNQDTIYENVTELLIPLFGEQHQPSLFNMLPFYHKKNSFNFSVVNVIRYKQARPALHSVADKNQFLNIETENRQIDADRLKANIQDDSQYINIRGINKNDFELYKPDSRGLFKCLNSNVT